MSMEEMKKPYETPYFKAFWTGFLIFAISCVPTLFTSRGAFIYYGDFNVQQIPFYVHAHDLIRSGNFLYDFSTDLGGSVIGTYSFYLLGSPFFYLTIPFPSRYIPWLMPWIIAAKYGVMMLSSFAYLRKHTRTDEGAFLGALLFSFSGYQGSVLVFNHFHDAVAFFPLFLLTFENLLEKKKYLGFIIMTAVSAAINYYFFAGEALFLVIYFVTLYIFNKEIEVKEKLRLLLRAFLSALLGLLIVSPYLIPAISYAAGNDRVKDFLLGYDIFSYKEPTMILGIIKSAVMVSDVSGLKGLFNESMSRVAGLGAYLPMFSISGVVAYFISKKNDRVKKLFTVLLVFAAVPVLNASFSMFNSEYYARWFYIPVLFMALMTARSIEDYVESGDAKPFGKGIMVSAIATVFFIIAAAVPYRDGEDISFLIFKNNPEMFLAEAGVSLVLLGLLIFFFYKDKFKHRRIFICIACFVSTIAMMITGSVLTEPDREKAFIDQAVLSPSPIHDNSGFYRIETEECIYNYPLMWEDTHSITSFISTIPPSTMDFYDAIGVPRKVTSYLNEDHEGARALLSAKYFLKETGTSVETISFMEDPGKLEGYALAESTDNFDIYENRNFLPMGFSFDEYITEDEYKEAEFGKRSKDRILIKSLILTEEDAAKYGHLLDHTDVASISSIGYGEFTRDIEERKASACEDFATDKHGFSVTADMEKENILFFSVPYEKNFKAYVDGTETDIIKCDFGFMGVVVPEGRHEVRFKYGYYNFLK